MILANRFLRDRSEASNLEQNSRALNSSQVNSSQSLQAYEILHAGFVIAPLVAGADKFVNGLVDWDQYLAPEIPANFGMSSRSFMRLVGVIEMTAGIGVAIKPRIFAYVVSGWLLGIVGNLGLRKRYYDIALRDVGLALGALALGRLSHQYEGTARKNMGRDILGRRVANLSTAQEGAAPLVRKVA